MRLFARQRWVPLFAAVAVMAAPMASYAQFGALGNLAKGKALEVLTNKVMEGLEKKFAEIVAKEPISDAAKAEVVKKLSDISRPIVKKFIDGAASGKLPNPMELVQTVLKDVLPRIPEVIAAAKAEGGGQAAAPAAAPQVYVAGGGGGAAPSRQPMGMVQQLRDASPPPPPPKRDMPQIAVYVSGTADTSVDRALAVRLIAALVKSGRYRAADDYTEIFYKAAEARRAADDSLAAPPPYKPTPEQIKSIGEEYGIKYICVAEVASVFGAPRLFARILDAETGEIAATGAVAIQMETAADLTAAAGKAVKDMFRREPPPAAPVVVVPPLPPPPPPAPCEETAGTKARHEDEPESERRAKTGFTLGYGFSGDATLFQLGTVHIRPLKGDVMSLVVEADILSGEGKGTTYTIGSSSNDYNEKITFYGVSVPVTCRFEKSVVFSEAGVFADILSGESNMLTSKEVWMVNVGAVLGGGFTFSKGYTQYFYRFSYGTAYYSQMVGLRQLF